MLPMVLLLLAAETDPLPAPCQRPTFDQPEVKQTQPAVISAPPPLILAYPPVQFYPAPVIQYLPADVSWQCINGVCYPIRRIR